ncbi:GT2 family glycosyltransferase [Novosphingobium sp. PhB55]|nr:GT2 family glycosyltransferase [Novosphingobium sp. PhB55]
MEFLRNHEPEGTAYRIAVHIHLAAESAPADISAAIRSVLRQSREDWSLYLTSHDGQLKNMFRDSRIFLVGGAYGDRMTGLLAALQAAHHDKIDHLVPLEESSRLSCFALAAYAAQSLAASSERPMIVYGDQTEQTKFLAARNPWLKPPWDPEMFLEQDYISRSCALPVKSAITWMVNTTRPLESVFSLVLELAMLADVAVQHVPRLTVMTPAGAWRYSNTCRERAVRRYLDLCSCPATIAERQYGILSITYDVPKPEPLVSVIVPTRDHLTVLRTCIDGILSNTDYLNFEIIVVDNGSTDPETLDYLDEIRQNSKISLINWPHEFNYSKINNFAAEKAGGEFLCFLNNDVEIIDGRWLSSLIGYAARPEVGAVGAKLLYPDGTIQHAGVVVGMGNAAGHAHRGDQDNAPGYFGHSLVTRRVSGVTAACMVVKKSNFLSVRGFDEEGLAIAYNDVDLCLKLISAGLKNIYVSSAKLIHHESKSRANDMAPEQLSRYMAELSVLQQRWLVNGRRDPWFHEKLDLDREVYTTKF